MVLPLYHLGQPTLDDTAHISEKMPGSVSSFPIVINESKMEISQNSEMSEKSKLQEYIKTKSMCNLKLCLNEKFFSNDYREDYDQNLRPKPLSSIEAYKDAVSSIIKRHPEDYSKNIKEYSGKKTLCIGLENILMSVSISTEEADATIPIYINQDIFLTQLSINFRPFYKEFLYDMKAKYEIILYSALNESYVNAITNELEKDQKYFAHIFTDDFCLFNYPTYSVKCLDFLLKNRSLKDIVLIDTTVKCIPASPNNFIPIIPYRIRKETDIELPKLAIVLDYIMSSDDVQKRISLGT